MKRLQNETFEEYKERRKLADTQRKEKLKPRIFWLSKKVDRKGIPSLVLGQYTKRRRNND